jgi:hypothetical protein
MEIEIVPCSPDRLEKLIAGADAFLAAYGFQVVDGFLPFAGVLEYSQNEMQASPHH